MKLFGQQKIEKLKIFEGIDSEIVGQILENAERKNFISGEVIIEQ